MIDEKIKIRCSKCSMVFRERAQKVRDGFQTNCQHCNRLITFDTGPDEAKASIQGMLDKFLEEDSPLRPIETKAPREMTDPGPVTPYVPVAPTPEMGKRVGSASSATVARSNN